MGLFDIFFDNSAAKAQAKAAKAQTELAREMADYLRAEGETAKGVGLDFFQEWIDPQLPDIKGVTGDIMGQFDAIDAAFGDLASMYGTIGDSMQMQIDAAKGLPGEIDAYKSIISQIGTDIGGLTADQQALREKQNQQAAFDRALYENEGAPAFNAYAQLVNNYGEPLDPDVLAKSYIGDITNQQLQAEQAQGRALAGRGVNASSEAATDAAGERDLQYALAKATAANRARLEARTYNDQTAARKVGFQGDVAKLGQTLDKSAQDTALSGNLIMNQGALGQAQAGLAQTGANLTSTQQGLLQGVQGMQINQANTYGAAINPLQAQQNIGASKSGLQLNQISALSGLQAVKMSPYNATLGTGTTVYQGSNAAATSLLNSAAGIEQQGNNMTAEIIGTALGVGAKMTGIGGYAK